MNIKKVLSFLLILIIAFILANLISTLVHNISDYEDQLEAVKTQNGTANLVHYDHIFVVVMENRSYEEIVGNKNSLYVNKLITEGALAANYYAVTHPSLPNYIALLGGSTFGINNNCMHCFIKKTNLLDQLDSANISWKAYFESLPKSCFLGSQYPYTRKYNAFVYFTDIIKDQKRCKQVVPYSQLLSDLKSEKTTPDFVWIAPNLCHDTHYCNVGKGDSWLAANIPKILNSSAVKTTNSLLIITWDEAEKKGTNHIAAIFIGNSVKKNFISHKHYNHYSLLHTIEAIWNIKPITSLTTKNEVMSDMFVNNN